MKNLTRLRSTEIAVPVFIAATLWIPRLIAAPKREAVIAGFLCIVVVVGCAVRESFPVAAPCTVCLSTVCAWLLEATNDPLIAFSWSLMPLGVRFWNTLSDWVPLLWAGVFLSLVVVVDGVNLLGVTTVQVALILAEADGRRQHALAQEAEAKLAAHTARELHDGIGHALSLIRAEAGLALMTRREATGHAVAREAIERIDHHAQRAYRELELIIDAYSYGGEEEFTLADTIEADRAAGLIVTVHGPVPTTEVPVQIIKEMLRNARQHAKVSRCELEFARTATQWVVRCVNPVESEEVRSPGRGLRNIDARSRALGGSAIWGAANGEFSIEVRIPVVSKHEATWSVRP